METLFPWRVIQNEQERRGRGRSRKRIEFGMRCDPEPKLSNRDA
jgi:hypothetical protein